MKRGIVVCYINFHPEYNQDVQQSIDVVVKASKDMIERVKPNRARPATNATRPNSPPDLKFPLSNEFRDSALALECGHGFHGSSG